MGVRRGYALRTPIFRLYARVGDEKRITMIKLPYQYLWQNPILRPVMYPVREQKLRDFLLIYDEASLVAQHASQSPAERAALVNAELQNLSQRYNSMDHDALLSEILDRFDADSDHQLYPDWLRYMVVHFSGMRYKSAHGSWADETLLIPRLEDMQRETLKKATPQEVAGMAQKAGLTGLPADVEAQKTAVFNYLTAQELASPGLPPEQAGPVALERIVVMKDRMGFPSWFWKEVVSHTALRLAVQKGDWLNDWENLSLDDVHAIQQSTDFRWQTVLFAWKQDIAAWRQKHYMDLTLVVTRAVCNELSEHVHHLRGIKPASGLTGKPVWYKNLAGGPPPKLAPPQKPGMEKEKAALHKEEPPPVPVNDLPDGVPYFGRALNRSYFKPGASILSLGWTPNKPNPWQIANPIGGVDFQEQIDPTWKYATFNNEITRTKPAPPPPGVMLPQHKDEKAGPLAKSLAPGLKQWLRWTHEAIVVGVFDLLDGQNVITFETYPKTGINRTRIGNKLNVWSEFLGFAPTIPFDPVKDSLKIGDFQAMLRREALLLAAAPAGGALSFDISSDMVEAPPLEILGEPAAAAREIGEIWKGLTPKQRAVVALICNGYSTHDAAMRLDTRLSVVKAALTRAMAKFGVATPEALQILLANWDFGEHEEDSTE
jgi:DNA-binding CsgD family transcriptional regulator